MGGESLTSPFVGIQYSKQSGGLNSTASPLAVADNESPDLQNVDFNKFGSVLKRSGSTQVNTTAFNAGAVWTSLYWFQTSASTNFLIGTCGNQFGTWADGVLTGSPANSTGAVTITAGNNNLFQWASFLDTALGTNGVDVPIRWTGSGNAAAMTVPTGLTRAKWISIFSPNTFIFLANVTVSGVVAPSRLYWSDINALTYTATNFVEISRNDGQDITGLHMLGEELIIFKDRSIYKGIHTGDRDIPFVFTRTRSDVGCISGYSIQEVTNGLLFESADGFYFFDGNNSYKLSDRVTTTLGTYESARFQYTQSAYQHSKNRYWSTMTLSGGTTNSQSLMFDSSNNAWSRYKGQSINALCTVWISKADERIYFADYAGFVYRADVGTNDIPAGVSTAIDAYYYTKWFTYEDIVHSKGTPNVYIYYQLASATLTFAYSYDGETADTYTQTFSTTGGTSLYGTALYGTGIYSSSGGAVTRRDLTGRGRMIRFKYANATLGETIQIDGIGALAYAETSV